MHELAPLIYDLAIMLGLAGIVTILFQRIRQPVVLGYLVAGIIVGPHTPPYALVSDINNIQILSELGVIFLMFSLGLEFSFKKLTQVGFSASVTGSVEVILMAVIGYFAATFLGWTYYDSIFLGAALAISSTTIIIKAIEELGLKSKRFAELIFGVLIVEDLLAILLLVALTTLVTTKNVFSLNMVGAVFQLFLVVGGWFLLGYFLLPPLFRRIANYISQETLTIISVALCLFLVCVAARFHYSAALGAFIMGSILAETVLAHRIEELIRPIRDIFAAVFFISVGMLIDPVVIVQNWPQVFFIALITVSGKIFTTTLGALLTGQSINTSLRSGFSMAQIGEFSFIIAALGVTLNVTSSHLYPLIVAVSGITTFTTPYLIRLSAHAVTFIQNHLPMRSKYYLDSYSAWIYRAEASQQHSNFGKVVLSVIVNGMIVAIIFTLMHYFIYHHLKIIPESYWLANVLLLFVSLLLSSPFIWGMVFSYKKMQFTADAKATLNPLAFIISLLTLIEVAILSIVYFHTWITTVLFLAIGATFFILAYQKLEKSYHWFEKQIMTNLKINPDKQINIADLTPWDTHLVAMEVPFDSPLIGKTIAESKCAQEYQIIIVAISRDKKLMVSVQQDQVIQKEDKLVLAGNDEKIDALKANYRLHYIAKHASRLLDHFQLKAILIASNSFLIGKRIHDLALNETVNGVIIGLERNTVRTFNPAAETTLLAGDLLLTISQNRDST